MAITKVSVWVTGVINLLSKSPLQVCGLCRGYVVFYGSL